MEILYSHILYCIGWLTWDPPTQNSESEFNLYA